jgi:hypothetical protein
MPPWPVTVDALGAGLGGGSGVREKMIAINTTA